MIHPDQKYINALLHNDTALLEEIYARFSGKIKYMVLQNNGTETDAADIFQEALLSIYKRAKAGNFTLTCPFEAFLYRICKNKWLNKLKNVWTRNVTMIDSEGYNSDNVNEDSFHAAAVHQLLQDRSDLLIEKFNELGESCKKLLCLSWSGRSMEEVAETLNFTYGYARKKKCECMEKLSALVRNSPQFNSLKW
jgi:RNA polymerase sigma factor (sigma-70 family)